MMALMAPDAPTMGIVDAGFIHTCVAAAATPVRTKNTRNRRCPMESSTLFPKIHRNHRFPMRCIQLPCRNMEEIRACHVSPPGGQGPDAAGCPVTSAGMAPSVQMDPRSAEGETPAPCT
jgi:hypothetical protein